MIIVIFRPDPFMPETGRAWFIVYAIAAWCYRWVILLSISLFMATVLKPYGLQAIGISLLVVSMGGISATKKSTQGGEIAS